MTGRRRYQLLSTLGAGGFGTVYQAKLLGGGGFTKNVALKLPHPERASDPEVGQRMREEARMLGLVRHRAIVHVDSLVLLNGSWTVVMEYVDGVDLVRVIQAGTVPVRVALAIVEEVASALHVAYTTRGHDGERLRLVHRDVKPSNVLLTAAGEVKVLDFGIARSDLDPLEVTTLSNAGSRLYMSPERLDGIEDPRADVYSLGALLFELLTGKAFGKSSGHPDRHAQRLALGLAHVRSELGDEGEGVATLVGDMLQYEPGGRPWPRDVERAAADLGAALEGPRLRDWAERHVPELRPDRRMRDPFRALVLAEQTEEEAARCDPLALATGLTPAPVPRREEPRDVLGAAVEDSDLSTRPVFEQAGREDSTTVHFVGPGQEFGGETGGGAPGRIDHVLLDATGTPAPPPQLRPDQQVASSPRRRPLALVLMAALVSFVVLVALAVLMVWGPSRQGPAPMDPALVVAEPTTPPSPPAEVSEPEEDVDLAAPAEPPSGPADAERAAVAPSVASEVALPPAEEPVLPAPDPVPPTPAFAVSVAGDAASVALVAEGQRHVLPAEVSPGDYGIEATFGGRTVAAGRVVVGSGPATVTCRALFLRCSAE